MNHLFPYSSWVAFSSFLVFLPNFSSLSQDPCLLDKCACVDFCSIAASSCGHSSWARDPQSLQNISLLLLFSLDFVLQGKKSSHRTQPCPPFPTSTFVIPEVLLECMHYSTDDYRSRSRFLQDLPTRDIDHLPCTVYVLVAEWINCPKQKTIKFFTYATCSILDR